MKTKIVRGILVGGIAILLAALAAALYWIHPLFSEPWDASSFPFQSGEKVDEWSLTTLDVHHEYIRLHLTDGRDETLVEINPLAHAPQSRYKTRDLAVQAGLGHEVDDALLASIETRLKTFELEGGVNPFTSLQTRFQRRESLQHTADQLKMTLNTLKTKPQYWTDEFPILDGPFGVLVIVIPILFVLLVVSTPFVWLLWPRISGDRRRLFALLRRIGLSCLFAVYLLGLLALTEYAVKTILLADSHVGGITHPVFGWVVRGPNQFHEDRVCYGNVTRTYNSLGMRSTREFKSIKPPGTLRICVFGDSWTDAATVSDGKPFFQLLERYLNTLGYRVQVLAFGAYGYGTTQQYLRFKHECMTFDPDILLWQFHPSDPKDNSYRYEKDGGLDSIMTLRPYLENGEIVYRWPMHIRIPHMPYTSKYLSMILLKPLATPERIPEFEAEGFQAMDITLAKAAHLFKGPKIALIVQDMGRDPDPRMIAAASHNGFVPLVARKLIDGVENCTPSGDSHPNVAGHAVLFETIREAVLKAVQNIAGPPPGSQTPPTP